MRRRVGPRQGQPAVSRMGFHRDGSDEVGCARGSAFYAGFLAGPKFEMMCTEHCTLHPVLRSSASC